MKIITKILTGAFTALTLFIGTNVNAQTTSANKLRFGIGLELGAPTGNAHSISNFELGGTARLQYGVSNNLAVTLTSGYYNMFGKSYTFHDVNPGGITTVKVDGQDLGMIPVKIGIKSFFAHHLYFGAEVGAGFETTSAFSFDGSKDTKLILSPTIGFASRSWDVGLRYENFSGQSNNYGLIGLRLAYGFGL